MKIIKQREYHVEKTYYRRFSWKNRPNAGFFFPCDVSGNVGQSIDPAAKDNYNKCLNGTYDVIDEGIETHTNKWSDPAVGICNVCGEEVELFGFTNTCDKCYTDYNMSGQQLADRSQWGEETGESLDDILRIR